MVSLCSCLALILALTHVHVDTRAGSARNQNTRADHVLDAVAYPRLAPREDPTRSRGEVEAGGITPSDLIDVSGVTVTLASLDRTSYVLGDPIVYEIFIRNGGRTSLVIPWNPDPEAFVGELHAPTTSRASVFLEVRNDRAERVAWLEMQGLLGSAAVAGGLETIAPGETALLRLPGRWRTNTDADARALIAAAGRVRMAAVLQLKARLIPSVNEVEVLIAPRNRR